MTKPEFIHIMPQKMEDVFFQILKKNNVADDKARITASVFTSNAVDGVYTHSVNRFPKFIQYLQQGHVRSEADAVVVHQTGCLEQWEGNNGIGIINAQRCTDRATALAKLHGMGCVAIAHTNHWMRGGAYGWQAAKKGYALIAWTNTNANTPAWGAIGSKLGNNPLVISVPYENEAIVLDMAMSQYSYGSMEMYKLKGERLPVLGGYDENGNLSDDPDAITRTRRTLPIGYWKGSGLSLLLDILATILSGGLSVAEVEREPVESRMSQVFIAFDLSKLRHSSEIPNMLHRIIADFHDSPTDSHSQKVRFPGERILKTRRENTTVGIPVLKTVWEEINAF
jgi:3-dehydro-L-gulonate 2-dehydrogenase